MNAVHTMFKTIKALVLREVRYKEADRILTLLSAEEGKLTVKARGALRKSSRTGAATQQLTYAEMTLFGNRGKWTVNEASVLEGFDGLRTDLEALALGSYFAECLEALSVEEQPDAELMQLGLNSLYALSRGLYDARLIKAAFEFRLMCLSGYAPDLSACAACGGEPADPVFQPAEGRVYCRACPHGGGTLVLGPEALAAMRYLAAAPAKKLFSFSLGEEAAERLSLVAEQYLLRQTERRFGTLEYYKQIRSSGFGIRN